MEQWSSHFRLEGGLSKSCMCKHIAAKGVEGHSPLGKFRCPEIAEGGKLLNVGTGKLQL